MFKLDPSVSFENSVMGRNMNIEVESLPEKFDSMSLLADNSVLSSPGLANELNAAAILVRKVYKRCQTRDNLADCTVMVENLWWRVLEFAALRQSSITFFINQKPETAISRWARIKAKATKLGKDLSKDEKAKELILKYWLEAIDPHHRYGKNLHLYHVEWCKSQSPQPFFYWLDVGEGKEVTLEECSRTDLQHQCVQYLAPKEREAYEVMVCSGKIAYRQSGLLVSTPESTKWMFVLSASRILYVGEKKKGLFQHSSFVAGGATVAAGRVVASNGVIQAIWSYSGHYRPTEENFKEVIRFLEEHQVDLSHAKLFPTDDDIPPPPKQSSDKITKDELQPKSESCPFKYQMHHNLTLNSHKSGNNVNVAS